MSSEENKTLVRRFYDEVWNLGNTAFADEVFAEDYIRHDLRPTEALPGPAGQKKIADDFHRAFPDLEVAVDLIVAEDEFVADPPPSDLLGRQHLPLRGRQSRRDLESPR